VTDQSIDEWRAPKVISVAVYELTRKLRTSGTRSPSRSPSVNAVDLGRQDEVVLMQSLDLFGL
jgi:hypothetical protein